MNALAYKAMIAGLVVCIPLALFVLWVKFMERDGDEPQ